MLAENKYAKKYIKDCRSMRSVLKYQIGDEIKLKQTDFTLRSSAFMDEIERKFS